VDVEEHVADGMVHVYPLFSAVAEEDEAPCLAYLHC
jgi:hypothetical protein